jgi:hypothetical protein
MMKVNVHASLFFVYYGHYGNVDEWQNFWIQYAHTNTHTNGTRTATGCVRGWKDCL